MIPLTGGSEDTQLHRHGEQNTQWLPGVVEGEGELLFSGHRASVWEDEKVLETDGGD